MAQHDYVIANGTGAAVRSDINNGLAAIVSNNSGASAPSTTYAYMLWADTSTNLLKLRNGANSAWITVGDLTAANLGLAALASPTFTGTVTIPTATISTGAGIPLASAASPAIYFTGDTNTGIYSPGADQFAITTGGSGRVFVDSSGRVGLGTSTPSELFHVSGTSNPSIQLTATNDTTPAISVATDGTNRLQITSSSLVGGNINVRSNQELRFGTNNTERVRITSGGLVGIGTNPSTALHVATSGAGQIRHSDGSRATALGSTGSESFVGSGSNLTFLANGLTSSDEKMRLDTSGRLLVGTSSSSASAAAVFQGFAGSATGQGIIQLQVGKNTAATAVNENLGSVRFANSDGNIGAVISGEADLQWNSGDYPSRLVFSTTADGTSSPTERMRIGQSGFTKISNSATYNDTAGTYHELVTTLTGSNNVLFRAPASYGSDNIKSFVLTAAGTGFNHFLADSNGTTVCVIRGNGNLGNTNNVYTSLSDSKLKENIVAAGSQWTDIKALQVRKYNFKEETKYETHAQIGLVAQEVELVSPGLIEEYPDRDADGNDLGTTTKSVKYSVLYMKAVKALQEAMERIEALEAKVAALEAS